MKELKKRNSNNSSSKTVSGNDSKIIHKALAHIPITKWWELPKTQPSKNEGPNLNVLAKSCKQWRKAQIEDNFSSVMINTVDRVNCLMGGSVLLF